MPGEPYTGVGTHITRKSLRDRCGLSRVSANGRHLAVRWARFDAGDQALRLFNSEIGNPTNTMCVKSVPNNCQRSLGLIELNETCRRLIISCASAAKCCERCAADRGTTT